MEREWSELHGALGRLVVVAKGVQGHIAEFGHITDSETGHFLDQMLTEADRALTEAITPEEVKQRGEVEEFLDQVRDNDMTFTVSTVFAAGGLFGAMVGGALTYVLMLWLMR